MNDLNMLLSCFREKMSGVYEGGGGDELQCIAKVYSNLENLSKILHLIFRSPTHFFSFSNLTVVVRKLPVQ